MEKYILNETPVRTANNFGINNIEAILDIPEFKQFENFDLYTPYIEEIDINIDRRESKVNTNRIGLNRKSNYSVKITISENKQITKYPIRLVFELDEENDYLVENIDIILEKGASANFEIEWKMGNWDGSLFPKKETHHIFHNGQMGNWDGSLFPKKETHHIFHNGQINVILKENAKAKITVFNMLDENADSIYEIENEIEKYAEAEYVIAEIGGKNKISNYYSKLAGQNSKNFLNMIYLGKEKDVIDINYNMEMYGKKSVANINVQGAVNDYAKKNFKGTIDFKKGAQKAVGKENENCIILSQNTKVKSLPILLCSEEDVEGEHGVSSGKIDENKLFYIMSKGISYEDAKKLIIKASFNEMLQKVDNEELRNTMNEEIDKI